MAEAIKEWEFTWRGIAPGARIASTGTVREYGRTENEARRRVIARYPAITELSHGTEATDG